MYGVSALVAKLLDAVEDNHSVNAAIEPTVLSELEPTKVEHHLGNLEVSVCVHDELCRLLHLCGWELALELAKLRQVNDLTNEPFLRGLRAVCIAHLFERGCFAKMTSLFVVGVGDLVVDVKCLQKSVFISVPFHHIAGFYYNDLAADVDVIILCRF